MAITLHHKEIMILMTDHNLKVPVQHTSFPFEHPYEIDSAIEQLYSWDTLQQCSQKLILIGSPLLLLQKASPFLKRKD